MDVKSPLLVAYTRNLQPPAGRIGRPPLPSAPEEGSQPRIYEPEDIVDISEADLTMEIPGEAVTVSLSSPRYEQTGFPRIPARGSIIDTWA
ncbi:MAG TPA: hypothetical protein PK022_04780 [Syntrophales bacterium]|nr:hypothetical protein [Syntrophales bacterium]